MNINKIRRSFCIFWCMALFSGLLAGCLSKQSTTTISLDTGQYSLNQAGSTAITVTNTGGLPALNVAGVNKSAVRSQSMQM